MNKSNLYFSIIVVLFLPLYFTGISNSQSFIQGKVISVADGDTITVLQDYKQYKIRLYGIDTPEKKQSFGQKAKHFTSSMVFNKNVKVIPIDIDRYKRIVGMVYVDGVCLNEELIRNGYAWLYKKYCKKPFCNKWSSHEKSARENKLGLWIMKDPIPPWDFRKGRQNGSLETKTDIGGSNLLHGNLNSHVFHAPDCKHYNCKNCIKIFRDRKSAINSGYKPCGICKP